MLCILSSLFRWLCSSSPCQPIPSEPACTTHPQPDADEPHARRLWQHIRLHDSLFRVCSAHHHGPPGRDGPHGPRSAWNGSWCCWGCRSKHWDERWYPSLHVHAPAPDEHATPGWNAAHWDHQPLPFVKVSNTAYLRPPTPHTSYLFQFDSIKSFKMNKEMFYSIYVFITNL